MALDKQVSLKLEKGLYEKVENKAKEDRRSVNFTITEILENFFTPKEKKKKSD
jgi:hypothetical protein